MNTDTTKKYYIEIRGTYSQWGTQAYSYAHCTNIEISCNILSFVSKNGAECMIPWLNVIRIQEEKE